MNKKFSTLVAGLLAVGAWTTLDAKVVNVATPAAGGSYLIGTTANPGDGNDGLVSGLLSASALSARTDVTGLPGYDLDSDSLRVTKSYGAPVYFETEDGYLTVNSDCTISFLKDRPTAAQSYNASWMWCEGKLVSVAAKAANKNAQLTVRDTKAAGDVSYGLAAIGSTFYYNTWLQSPDSPLLTGCTLSASASVNASDASAPSIFVNGGGNIVGGTYDLSKSVPSGYCVVALKNGSTTNYLKAGVPNNVNDKVVATNTTDYENYLWSVSNKEVNGILYYTFTSLAKDGNDPIVWTVDGETSFVANEAYSERGITLATSVGSIQVNGATAAPTTTVIGLYDAFDLAKTVKELNSINNPGFEMTVKYEKDEKKDKTIENVDVLQQMMYPKGTDYATAFELWSNKDFDSKMLVLDTKGTVGSDVVGEFKWLTQKEFDKGESGQYLYHYQFQYALGNPNVISKLVVIGKGNVSILFNDGKYYLTTSVAADAKLPYIKLGASNVYDVKKLLGQYLSFAYADTKANTPKNEQYKLNTLLTVVSENSTDVADFALGTSTSLPEAQWAVTAANLSQNTVTLTNRENPNVELHGVQFRVEGNKFVMTAAGPNVSSDLVTMTATALNKTTSFDGYMRTTPNALRNENFYLGQYHAIEGNNNAYFIENHTEAGSHQIGMTAKKENAQKWNLHFAMKLDDDQKYTLVDTVKVPITFATYKDGKIITSGDDAVKDTLFILPYAFQNASNRELVSYKPEIGKGFEFYYCNKDKKEDDDVHTSPAVIKFALKMKPDNTYNFVEITSGALSANKVVAGNSANKGILSRTGTYVYNQNENSLMVVEKADAPEYHKIAMAWGDTIKLFREENESQVVYEKLDAKSIVGKDTLSFLNIDNINQFKLNPAIFADTAYINRVDANGELNTCYQYLLAVEVDKSDEYYCPYNPEHNKQEWKDKYNGGKPCADAKENKAVKGRFLVNLIDTANVYGVTHLHNNPYINEVEAGDNFAKLSFVEATHADDTLYITRNKGGEVVKKLAMDTTDFNVAKFAFRYVDKDAKTFKIQTQWKKYIPTEDVEEVEKTAENNGYLRWINGTLVVAKGFENGDVFGIEENYEGDPVANENAPEVSAISVVATNGAVIINGAAGKKVSISNVLGQTVANTVISSDNATISAPAGVVIVAVEGETAVKAIVK